MAEDWWIVVPNWRRHQHYKDRTPAWIKVYLELNYDDEWLSLTDAARGLLVRIWILTAASNGRVRMNLVRKQGWSRHHLGLLASLSDAGFIQIVASKPLARTLAQREVREIEENGPLDFDIDKDMLELAHGWLRDHDPNVA